MMVPGKRSGHERLVIQLADDAAQRLLAALDTDAPPPDRQRWRLVRPASWPA